MPNISKGIGTARRRTYASVLPPSHHVVHAASAVYGIPPKNIETARGIVMAAVKDQTGSQPAAKAASIRAPTAIGLHTYPR